MENMEMKSKICPIEKHLKEILIHWEAGDLPLLNLLTVRDNGVQLEVGIGHVVNSEQTFKLGDIITVEEMTKLFEKDVDIAVQNAHLLVKDYYKHPSHVRIVLCAMAFQFDFHGAKAFKGILDAVDDCSYEEAAKLMVNSRWSLQTGRRCKSMARLMRGASVCDREEGAILAPIPNEDEIGPEEQWEMINGMRPRSQR